MKNQILGLVSCLAIAAVVYGQEAGTPATPAPSNRQFTIQDCVNEFTPARIESTKAGYQYWFVGREFLDGRTVKMSVVRPHDATHPPHRHAEDEIFFVLEGSAEVILNGEKKVVHPYASFYCPSDSVHGIRNVGDTDLKYLVIKKYQSR